MNIRRLTSDSVIYGLGTVISRVASFLMLPLYARILSPSEFGAIDIVGSVSLLATLVGMLSLEAVASRYYYKTETPSDRVRLVSTWVSTGTLSTSVCALAMGALAYKLAGWTTHNPGDVVLFVIAAWTLVPGFLTRGTKDILRLRFATWKFLGLTLLEAISTAALGLWLVVGLKMGAVGYLLAMLGAQVLASIIGLMLTRHDYRWMISPSILKGQMLPFALPLVPAQLASWAIQSISRYYLASVSLIEVGLYGMAFRLSLPVILAVEGFRAALVPFQYSIERNQDAKMHYGRVLTYYTLAATALAVPISLYGKEILLVLAPTFIEAAPLVGLLCYWVMVLGYYPIFSIGASLSNRTGLINVAATTSVLATVALSILIVPSLKATGAALATLGGQALAAFLLYHMSQRYHRIPFDIVRTLKLLVIGGSVVIIGSAIDAAGVSMLGALGVKTLLLILGAFLVERLKILDVPRLMGRLVGPVMRNISMRAKL